MVWTKLLMTPGSRFLNATLNRTGIHYLHISTDRRRELERVLCFGKEMPTFLIKHKLSGKYFHPKSGMNTPSDGTHVVIHDDIHSNTYFKFDQQDNHWGYIVHVGSGKCIHPKSGSMHPDNGEKLVLHGDRHAGAYFAIDQTNNIIMHKGGKFAHPKAGNVHTPPNGNNVVIHGDIHDGMKFEFVSTTNTSEEVFVYGKPIMVGSWKIINLVLNPRAEHTDTMQYKIGKSKTESTDFSFTYKWESSGGINIDIFSASVSQSLEFMLKTSSSTTWSEEVTRTREIKVKPGESVVTWQYTFEITQDFHKGVYKSNLLADTDSEKNMPRELGGEIEIV